MKLIAGLGNPGKQYATSRHNIGFLVINRLAKANGIELKGGKFKSRWGKGKIEGQSVILAKPQTFMNLSGEAVSAIAQYYKIIPQDIIIVHDDLDIPFGSLKIKTKGGSGGHHGLDSIIALLHDDRFLRVRIGIGKPLDERDEADFVLSPFNDSESAQLETVIDQANNCLGMLITHDPEFAMNRFHRKEDAKE
ncbi:MAG: aminoacyl-tRNA hydrolase [Thermodesulfobacteriota bacterium]|nr:aminoacyl-tRNA hydrolase [Thermodesulfobacteriota bacterium]